jgi:hypothetical protein
MLRERGAFVIRGTTKLLETPRPIGVTRDMELIRRILLAIQANLSWEGHEFVAAIFKEELWQKRKSSIGPGELASISLKAIKDASIAAATAYLKGKPLRNPLSPPATELQERRRERPLSVAATPKPLAHWTIWHDICLL